MKGELKVREFEEFKAEYCGLCRELRKNFGFAASLTLSYDFTVFAMLLASDKVEYAYCRCAASPFKRKCVCTADFGICSAAQIGVLLAWHKLRDDVKDGKFFSSLKARIESLLLRRAYKKAKKQRPEEDDYIAERLAELAEIEKESPDSIDKPADCFAKILAFMAGKENRALEQLLYHLGRWIYLVDAWDDLPRDYEKNRYNPIIYRFDLKEGKLGSEDEEKFAVTITHSENMIRTAFELLPLNRYTPQLENIFYFGLPAVVNEVRQGRWRKKRDRRPK